MSKVALEPPKGFDTRALRTLEEGRDFASQDFWKFVCIIVTVVEVLGRFAENLCFSSPTSIAEICGDDEPAQRARGKTSESRLAESPKRRRQVRTAPSECSKADERRRRVRGLETKNSEQC